MNCDGCKHYNWYYDRCAKWGCEVDGREIHNCFEKRPTLYEQLVVGLEQAINGETRSVTITKEEEG